MKANPILLIRRDLIKIVRVAALIAVISGQDTGAYQRILEKMLKRYGVKKKRWPKWPVWKN